MINQHHFLLAASFIWDNLQWVPSGLYRFYPQTVLSSIAEIYTKIAAISREQKLEIINQVQ
jgi:hypothetical protein